MRGDVVDALKKCAEALQHGNSRLANAEMGRVLDLAGKETEPRTRRLIRYFAQALACRAYGLHPKCFSFQTPDWKYSMCEGYGLFHTVGWAIEDVVKGKRKVHVIELVKHMNGYEQWASFFYGFYDLGDLTHLRLSFLVQENIEFSKESEEKLIRASSHLRIGLEYKIFSVNSFADIDVTLLELQDGEFVVVNCMFVFSKMLSEALALEKLLLTVRDVMKADIMIVAEHDANLNQSNFLLRFDESLEYYSSAFQDLNEYEYDYDLEIEVYYRYQICNMVACKGSNRVERHQTWAQWKSSLFRYGFSIFNLSTDFAEGHFWVKWENGIFVIVSARPEKQPLIFVSAWTTSTFPFKSSGSNEVSCVAKVIEKSSRCSDIDV
ncbi:hypothetical protein SLEP1_g44422 [Rubroshorea leprosula]|uniref:Uncharacterized protein n=1 Tax=Rubroshorea leprosula TaxID=152421 RepID=A0AAV5LG54_9ROSI|nr:hypothetical protein SLEP1_g44422 [Rubroshorea leprosula]